MRNYKAIGRRVRKLRHAKKMTAGQLGHIVGLSESQMRAKERGESIIGSARLGKIAEALGVSDEYLKTGKGLPRSHKTTNSSVNSQQGVTPAEHKRGVSTYAANAALAMEQAEEARIEVGTSQCHGGDMLSNEPSDAWGGGDLVREAWRETVADSDIPTPIQEVDARLAERYPAGKQYVARTPDVSWEAFFKSKHWPLKKPQPRESLWARFLAWLRG